MYFSFNKNILTRTFHLSAERKNILKQKISKGDNEEFFNIYNNNISNIINNDFISEINEIDYISSGNIRPNFKK